MSDSLTPVVVKLAEGLPITMQADVPEQYSTWLLVIAVETPKTSMRVFGVLETLLPLTVRLSNPRMLRPSPVVLVVVGPSIRNATEFAPQLEQPCELMKTS